MYPLLKTVHNITTSSAVDVLLCKEYPQKKTDIMLLSESPKSFHEETINKHFTMPCETVRERDNPGLVIAELSLFQRGPNEGRKSVAARTYELKVNREGCYDKSSTFQHGMWPTQR